MRNFLIGTAVVIACCYILLNYVGFTSKTLSSPYGSYSLSYVDVGLSGDVTIRISSASGWTLYSERHSWAVSDAVPFAVEWFPDAVALIDHFDLGTSIKIVALPSGDLIPSDNPRAEQITEYLRWQYGFTDFREVSPDGTVGGASSKVATYRIHSNPRSASRIEGEPTWSSDYMVSFRTPVFTDMTATPEQALSSPAMNHYLKTAESLLAGKCENPYVFQKTTLSIAAENFYSLGFSCYSHRSEHNPDLDN